MLSLLLAASAAALLPSPLPSQAGSRAMSPLPSQAGSRAMRNEVQIGRRAILTGAALAAVVAPPPLPAAAAEPIFTPKAGSLSGTTMLITGANTGLGLESAKRLASAGARVVVAGRSAPKAEAAAAAVAAETGTTGIGAACI